MKKVVGVELSHKHAPIEVREQLALNKEQVAKYLQELNQTLEEVFIISTCNRLSLYAFAEDYKPLQEFFLQFGNFNRYLTILSDTSQAVDNLFSTSAGLESQAIGEHQILGQIRHSLEIAREVKSIGPVLDELVRRAIHTGKRVRGETNIGKYSASLATVGMELIRKNNYNLSESSILVIGTGNMANLVANILEKHQLKALYVSSHDFERAREMAAEWNGKAVDIHDLYPVLSNVDIIIGGTQAEVNILSEKELENSKCKRTEFALSVGNPKLFIDFGVPRNFNPSLKALPNVNLYDLDDIKKLTYQGLLKREKEIPLAEGIVAEEARYYTGWLKNRKAAPLLGAYWEQLQDLKDKEIEWLLPKMGDLSEAQVRLLHRYTHRLIRNISRKPFKSIKNFAQNLHEQEAPINTVKKVLNLEEVEIYVPKRKIVVGSRGSKLALTQTNWVVDKLKKAEPEYDFEIKIIRTKGDEGNINVVGAFTSAIEKALLEEEIDIAVHSLKDMPTEAVKGLIIASVPEREDHRDVLISKGNLKLSQLPKGARVGTGSLRRQIQLKKIRADFQTPHIQGNIDTRIKKLEEGGYDAIVLAAAGMKRIDIIDRATEIFTIGQMIPAVGQGALGIQTRDKQDYIYDLAQKINHPETQLAVEAERAFLEAAGGGCNQPIAAFAFVDQSNITIEGLFATNDGTFLKKGVISGEVEKHIELATKLSRQLVDEVEAQIT